MIHAHVQRYYRALLCIAQSILFGLFINTAFASDAPPVPKECHLATGAVLHHVSVIRWGQDAVTLKHDGGADPVRYIDMMADDRSAFEAARDWYADHPAPAPAASDNAVVVKGQAFIQTAGQDTRKLGAMRVYAIPLSAIGMFDDPQDTIQLPAPLASTTTDADGRFTLKVPGTDQFFIYAAASRFIPAYPNGYYENYEWHIALSAVEDRDNLLLQNDNATKPREKVEIDGN